MRSDPGRQPLAQQCGACDPVVSPLSSSPSRLFCRSEFKLLHRLLHRRNKLRELRDREIVVEKDAGRVYGGSIPPGLHCRPASPQES